jgi:hypothetical protein
MKISARSAFFAAFLLIATVPLFAQSASGGFHFSSGGHPLNIEFHGRVMPNGSADGQILLTGTVNVPDQDVDGEGTGESDELVSISIRVTVDCVAFSGNTAVLSGDITNANDHTYMYQRALLAVTDNGEGAAAPARDQFMWGLYKTPDINWTASDAELVSDPGVGLTWIATDFERNDDVGIPSHPDTTVDCHTFPTESYSFEELPNGGGSIQVRQ